MQYEFKYISTDNYELVYTNTKKEEVKIPFTRTTKMARDLQRIQVDARMEMYSALAEKGMTKEDLIIKRNDGKVIAIDATTAYSKKVNVLVIESEELLDE